MENPFSFCFLLSKLSKKKDFIQFFLISQDKRLDYLPKCLLVLIDHIC